VIKYLSVSKSFFWSLLGTGLPMVLGLFTIPTTMYGLGIERFGLLTLIWTAIGYFGLFDLGMGRALTHFVSTRLHKGREHYGPGVLRGLFFVLLLGVLGSIVMGLVSHLYINRYISVDAGVHNDVKYAAIWASLSIPLVTLNSGLRGILEGQLAFGKSALTRGILGGLNFGLPYIFVLLGFNSLAVIVIGLVVARALVVGLNVIWLRRLLFSKYKSVEDLWGQMKSMLNFGLWMSISNVVGPFMVMADRYFVVSVVGTSTLAYYTVPEDVLVRLLIIPAAWSTVWFPRFSSMSINNDHEQINSMLKNLLRSVTVVMGGICLVLGLLSHDLLSIWTDVNFADRATTISQILLVGVFFNSLAHIVLAALQGRGGIAITAKLHVVELIFFIPLLMYFTKEYGLIGASWVWSGRTIVDFCLLFYLNYRSNDQTRL
jgi:O-antigen/teichoic acid export membrane protein